MSSEFGPPSLESQYREIHPSNIPDDRLVQMENEIAEDGVYVGEVMPFGSMTGAVDVIRPKGYGRLLRVMPDAVRLPSDHPAVRREQGGGVAGVLGYSLQVHFKAR